MVYCSWRSLRQRVKRTAGALICRNPLVTRGDELLLIAGVARVAVRGGCCCGAVRVDLWLAALEMLAQPMGTRNAHVFLAPLRSTLALVSGVLGLEWSRYSAPDAAPTNLLTHPPASLTSMGMDGWDGFPGGVLELGPGQLGVGGPGVEGFEVEGDVFAGFPAA